MAWAALAAFSVIFSYILTLAIGLFFLGVGLLLLFGILGSEISRSGVLLTVFALFLGGTVLWSLIPRRDSFQPDGILIDLSRENRLRTELEAIAQSMGEQVPSDVYLIPSANAAVAQRGGILDYGSRRIMLLGLPLLQMLSVSQFRAVLAHEFGHFYARDTRLGPWVYNARSNMERVLKSLTRESAIFSFLNRFLVIGLANTFIVGGLVLYWKLFTAITQYISRIQEFRCDELACYVAGSENFKAGLQVTNRAAAAAGAYWTQVVMPVTALGYRRQVADGFARFMNVPAIANAASSLLAQQMASNATNALDSHPPLSARIEKVRAYSIPAVNSDSRPSIALIDDLPGLELRLLQKLLPAINSSYLRELHWDSAGSDVYLPLWRKQTAPFQDVLAQYTLRTLPEAVAALPELAKYVPEIAGQLLTREQRLGRALEALSCALTLALVDHGWRLHIQSGESYVQRESEKLRPPTIVANLKSGKQPAEGWVDFCEKNGIDAWPLAALH